MTVYVDNAGVVASVRNGNRIHHSSWSHLMADSREELVEFAVKKLGLRRQWLQNKPSGVHFDVTLGKRMRAVQLGAVEVDTRSDEWFRVVRQAKTQYDGN